MKMLFRGWRREVTCHEHPITPVESRAGVYHPGKEGKPLIWNGPFKAYGKASDLALSGAFLVEFTFEEKELENWLGKYVDAHPAAAARLLARMQAEAMIALAALPKSGDA